MKIYLIHEILFLDHSDLITLPSGIFIFSFGMFVSFYYYLLIHQTPRQRTFNSILGILLFIISTLVYCYIDGLIQIIVCTACNDGMRVLKYNDIYYDLIFVTSLILALLPALITTINNKNVFIHVPINIKKNKISWHIVRCSIWPRAANI